LSNTCKYTKKGGKVSIETHTVDSFAQVDVKDNGIGISTEDQSRIFSRFFRVDNSLTRETGGTGLGLSITKSLVEMQGGKIWVESIPEKGSTFSFTIPLA
jgi:signal transduction histidine kinase